MLAAAAQGPGLRCLQAACRAAEGLNHLCALQQPLAALTGMQDKLPCMLMPSPRWYHSLKKRMMKKRQRTLTGGDAEAEGTAPKGD